MFRKMILGLLTALGLVLAAPLTAAPAAAYYSPYYNTDPEYPTVVTTATDLAKYKVRDTTAEETFPATYGVVKYPSVWSDGEHGALILNTENLDLFFNGEPITPGLYVATTGVRFSGFLTGLAKPGYRYSDPDWEAGLQAQGPPLTQQPTPTPTETPTPTPTPEPAPVGATARVLNVQGAVIAAHAWDARTGDVVVLGDWDGDGVDSPAIRSAGTNTFRLSDAANGTNVREVAYGKPTDTVYVGDWDGDGTDTLAVRRGNTFYLANHFRGGDADTVTSYGRETDEVVVRKWAGTAVDTPSVRRGNEFHIKYGFTGGDADLVFSAGSPSDLALVGDLLGTGVDTVTLVTMP